MVAARGRLPVVVGVDGSEEAFQAARWAAEEAARRKAPLRIVHGGRPADRFAAEAAATLGPGAEHAVREEPPMRALLAESAAAAMLVVGVIGQDALPGVCTGSLPARLAAHARCPVAVVRGSVARRGPVVAGVDGGALSEGVIATAFEEAASRRVPLVVVHAWSDADFGGVSPQRSRYLGWEPVADAERALWETLATWQEKYPEVQAEPVVVRDRPRQLLLEWSRRAQLIVAGHRGRGGFAGLALGSTGQALIEHAHSTVLVVRPADWSRGPAPG